MATTNPSDVVALAADVLLPKWRDERRKLDRIDAWARWDHEDPNLPRGKKLDTEYRELAARAQAPWGDLLVGTPAQALYVEGYRRANSTDDVSSWRWWQINGMDGRQVALHRAALTYGTAYGLGLPGAVGDDPRAPRVPVMRGVSPREMLALYEDPAFDDWPQYAIRVSRFGAKKRCYVYDDEDEYTLEYEHEGEQPKVLDVQRHGVGFVPVVRYVNRFDLEGRSTGEIEPFIPLLGKIDQTSNDRLIVQRFASWIVRTIAGMKLTGDEQKVLEEKIRLKVEDILVAANENTKFGSLPATPLDGFIKAHDADIRALAAVSQTPAHEMLGELANLSAEALAAARASATAKVEERKHVFGEAHEQFLRLAAHIAGDVEAANDFEAQVQWRDTEIRSLAQAADALGKLATMLGVPVELLWEKIPGFTQLDVERAKQLADSSDAIVRLLEERIAAETPSVPDAAVA